MSHLNKVATRRDFIATRDAGESASRVGRTSPPTIAAASTGTLIGFDIDGVALVDLPASADARPLRARSCVDLSRADSGKEVALVYEDGDRTRPLIIGTLRSPSLRRSAPVDAGQELELGDGHLTLTGRESVTLRCGAASITLRADGKITIRGTEIEGRASGLHRIQGGSVRIN